MVISAPWLTSRGDPHRAQRLSGAAAQSALQSRQSVVTLVPEGGLPGPAPHPLEPP
jgi:hypothetical protein